MSVLADYERDAALTMLHSPEGTPGHENSHQTRMLDWEEWDMRRPFWHHAAAGSCAGLAEHVLIYPLDNIKTNLQAFPGSQPAPRFRDVFKTLGARGVVKGFFRGSATTCMGCIPAHIALFSTYEFAKERLIRKNQSNAELVPRAAICGGVSTFVHDLILTPTDVVKQRLQLGCYSTIREACRHLLVAEGIGCFFRSLPITMAMNIPYGCVMVAGNEFGKKRLGLNELQDAESVRRNLGWFFLSAGLSGAVAALCTQPLDVTKTRLQTQDCLLACQTTCVVPTTTYTSASSIVAGRTPTFPSGATSSTTSTATSDPCPIKAPEARRQAKYTGIADAFTKILAQEGAATFYKGSLARAAICVPAAAISWGTYESVKSMLRDL
eukprot:GEMP01005064.1.p1 GENE.GEMP01005064.1~~GEMP01005064.1.p1  ORF type:complete len:381 (+),score=85.86 GEMP01005064.1:1247-2389(+)